MSRNKILAGLILMAVMAAFAFTGCAESLDKKITRYIGELGSQNKSEARESFKNMLVAIGKPAIPHLIRNLEASSDKTIRAYCALALAKIGDSSAEEPIRQALKDKNPEVRASACVALTDLIGLKAIPHLKAALKDQESGVREEAQNCFVKMGEDAIDSLIEFMTQKDNIIRNSSKTILGRIGRKAVAKVTELMETSQDSDIQIVAARTLSDIGDKSALPAIGKVADRYTAKDEKTVKTRQYLDGAYNDLKQKP